MQKISLTLLALCVSLLTWANPVDVETANEIAQRFIKSRTESVNAAQGMHRGRAEIDMHLVYASTTGNTSSEYYVFASDEAEGFVIVSGDDQMAPIVGYSLTDRFSLQQMPPALKNLLSLYAQHVNDVRAGKVEPSSQSEEMVTPVLPFITTTWNQYDPYNIYCPEINGQATLTGCVATATAQIMNYYEWPRAGHGTCTATLNDGNNTPVTITLGQEYDWANMKDDYASSSYTEVEAQAVGLLMKDVGYACQLSYGVDWTGGYTPPVLMALLHNFDYSPDAYIIDKEYYSADAWRELIHGELLAGRPIWYRGEGNGGGHAFVCCGMDQQGAYYINWGWGGWSDGYFYFDALLDYNYYQQAVIGIKPIEEGESASDYVAIPHVGKFNLYRQVNSLDAPYVEIGMNVNNVTAETLSGYVGYALYEDGTMVSDDVIEMPILLNDLWPNYWYGIGGTVQFAGMSDLSPKEREIRFFWRHEDSDEWVDVLGNHRIYMNTTADGHYFYVTDNTIQYIEAVLDDGNYYLKNVATGQYLCAANDWGTRASVGPHGLDLAISRQPDGKYTLDTQIKNSDTQHFFGTDGQGTLYMDVAETVWTIGVLENGNYVFTIDHGTTFMGARGNVVHNLATNPMDDEALQWQLLTPADRMAELSRATSSNPVDATFCIPGANLGRSDARNVQWTGISNVGGENANNCSEKWNATTYDVYQTLIDLPNGLYELRVQGFYREGGANTPLKAAQNYVAGQSELNAILYANDQSTPLPSIMSAAKEGEAPDNHFYTTTMGYVPQDMIGASRFFSEGLYQTSLLVEVTDGSLRLGIRKEQGEAYDWSCFDNFELYYYGVSDVTITVNQYGSGTYCSPYALDFSAVEGLKAYAATGYNKKTKVVTLTRVMTTQPGEGLFIKGEPGTYKVPVIEEADDNSLNMLVGALTETAVNAYSTDGLYANYKYTIKEGDSQPLFYQFADGSTLGAGKAYLQIPVAWLPQTSETKSISLRFDEGEGTTDMENSQFTIDNSQLTYDLFGRRVDNPVKGGIYIVGGRKVVY